MQISEKTEGVAGLVLERELKSSEKGKVVLMRSREGNTRYIYREFQGKADIYLCLQQAECRYLPKVYSVETRNNNVCVLEEYIQGDSLAFILEGGPVTEEQAVRILTQICQGLGVLHKLGAVHRDIKPENIILRGSDAVLIDFDASWVIHPENDADTRIMGTTGYAAPEQYGFSQTDARADIYALGVLLNEMLTGQHPSKHLARSAYRGIIEKCIEVNVDKRYRDTEKLQRALRTEAGTGRRKGCIGIAAAVLAVICGILFPAGQPGTESPRVAGTEAVAVEPGGTSPSEAVPVHPVMISDFCWTGPENRYMTTFHYDLDGNGEGETYHFGIYQMDIPEGFRHAVSDNFWLGEDEVYQRTVYPCVWKAGGRNLC